jgi:hypothetical protein
LSRTFDGALPALYLSPPTTKWCVIYIGQFSPLVFEPIGPLTSD